ncbi:MAG: thiamine pyrophosphate-dependent enzyme [Candidatus Hodarchaeales archaeon]|jgi:2-oxoglutarate ferredoxin oxidoreductase subunit beta
MAEINKFDMGKTDIAWCPGCGNFGILNLMKDVLPELGLKPQDVVYVSGIGQAAKFPQYINAHYLNGLHGRSLAVATAIKAANPEMTVICESGDGCSFGEGGNHFVHNILRNPNVTNFTHDNMIYGLTKGQASPTSMYGFITPVQVSGVTNEPFNPLALAISLNASFVARIFLGQREHAKKIVKEAITHKGYALVDILQPCATFNKFNTFKWFRDNTYILEDYDSSNRDEAFKKAIEKGKLPLGVFYRNPKPTFEENNDGYVNYKDPLYKRSLDKSKLTQLINSKRTV